MFAVERVFGISGSRFVESHVSDVVYVVSVEIGKLASIGADIHGNAVYLYTPGFSVSRDAGFVSGVPVHEAVAYVCRRTNPKTVRVCVRLLEEEDSPLTAIHTELERRRISVSVDEQPAEKMFSGIGETIGQMVSTVASRRSVIFGCPSRISQNIPRRAGVECGGEECAAQLKLGVARDLPRVICARLPRRSERAAISLALPDAVFLWLPYAAAEYTADFEPPEDD